MAEKTDAQKRAQKNYIGKFVRLEVRVTPEKKKAIQAAAERDGKSLNAFINDAVDRAITESFTSGD